MRSPTRIGLRIFAPEATAARFRVGDNLSLFTHLQVRETELSLYGFEELDELVIFEALLGVSGIGPKVALATLSTLTPDALRLAVTNDEPGIVARVPGIGKRTSKRSLSSSRTSWLLRRASLWRLPQLSMPMRR